MYACVILLDSFYDELINELKVMNRRICLCFKKKIDKDLEERIVENASKSAEFITRIKSDGIDIQRIIDIHKNK